MKDDQDRSELPAKDLDAMIVRAEDRLKHRESLIERLEDHRDELSEYLTQTLGHDANAAIQDADKHAMNGNPERGIQHLEQAALNVTAAGKRVLDLDDIKREAEQHLNENDQNQTQALTP